MHCLILDISCHIYLNALALHFFPPLVMPSTHIYNLAVIFLKRQCGAIAKAILGFVTYKQYDLTQVT